MSRSLAGLLAFFVLAISPKLLAVDTYFIDQGSTFSGLGSWWTQGFTTYTSTTFVLRFTSDFKADAAIVPASQLSNFQNNRYFTGYAVFDDKFGTRSVTLAPGSYYVGVRNQISGSNTYRLELDYDIQVPADAANTYSYSSTPLNNSLYVGKNGGKSYVMFTINSGYRYFLDGCNSGLSTYIIPSDQISKFLGTGSFTQYTDYSGTDMALPGLDELLLAPGTYYLCFRNGASVNKAVTYTMESWKKTPKNLGGGGGGLDMSGAVSWQTYSRYVNIKAGKVANTRSGGRSGSLRLVLWATSSPYSGGGITGYRLGTRNLSPLNGGQYYSNISGWVGLTRPPRGSYYTTITLEEYNSGWFIVDYTTFSGRSNF